MIYSDRGLSARLERAEGAASADFVNTRARLHPESGAVWTEIAGAYAMFDGVGSPLTQTFGLGLRQDVTEDDLEQLENFFRERSAEVFHEVSPMADPSLPVLLTSRGYHPIELTNVMFRELADVPAEPSVVTRIAGKGEEAVWARTSAGGWSTEAPGLSEFMLEFGMISAQTKSGYPFLAEIDGKPAAAGMLFINDGIAMLAGASTVPEFRNRGAQNALLAARLRFAADQGCELAAMGALPGSQSQKNAQKNGFQIAYTRIKWSLTGAQAALPADAA